MFWDPLSLFFSWTISLLFSHIFPQISLKVWHCALHCKHKFDALLPDCSSSPQGAAAVGRVRLSAMFMCNEHRSVFFPLKPGPSICPKEFYWLWHQWPKHVGSDRFLNAWPVECFRNGTAVGLKASVAQQQLGLHLTLPFVAHLFYFRRKKWTESYYVCFQIWQPHLIIYLSQSKNTFCFKGTQWEVLGRGPGVPVFNYQDSSLF